MSKDRQNNREIAEPNFVPEFGKGDRLRKARELTGLPIREFAELIGVSHQTITNAEREHRPVRRITMNAWSFHTGVSLQWLETGSTARDQEEEG